MSTNIIGIGEFGASKTPGDVVKTLALGSCVAVILLYPPNRTVGMVHVALPEANINLEKAAERPGYFADTGVPALFRTMVQLGCKPNGRDYIIKLAGGAKVMDPNSTFNIGKRNVLAIKKILWQRRMGAVKEEVGGSISRTVAVHVDTGKVVLTSSGRGQWQL